MPAEPRWMTVVDRESQAAGVVALELSAADGPLPAWEPGAHVDLVLGPGLVRQYSLCGDPAEPDRWRVAVLRDPAGRGGSVAVHDRLRPGSRVEVVGPRNAFRLEPAPAYLFLAGGIGITPILPMVRQVARLGLPWLLGYGGRTSSSMAFLDELRALDGGAGRLRLHPQDTCGLLPLDELVGWAGQAGADVYCCGPEPMLEAVRTAGRVLGPERVRFERFRPAGPDQGSAGPDGDRPFELEVRPLGLTLTVPAGRSVLESLEEAGTGILSSCREGTCGTCEVTVLEGAVEHRDSLLTETERAAGDTMFPCVSRAAGPRLVIEL